MLRAWGNVGGDESSDRVGSDEALLDSAVKPSRYGIGVQKINARRQSCAGLITIS